ncbi:MAG: class I SAM-dependent methyltransferase [Candidatus Methanomethylophilaceae archaeon]|nr:class I SAM-dependent methyltransferase [Candidatus Methanomethylophilaceae archaeon]
MTEDLSQCACPHGDKGEETIEGMNEEHVPQITWGLVNLPDIDPERILDIGCGGGIFTKLILEKYPRAKAWGIDISEISIDYSKRFNSGFIDEGRLELCIGNVADMPYEDGFFDLIVSNASHFFWPDLPENLKEVSRVLKKGGVLCLTVGIHTTDPDVIKGYKEQYPSMNIVSDDTLISYMESAGMESEYRVKPESAFCCYIGTKR